jgi:hypothetical protein
LIFEKSSSAKPHFRNLLQTNLSYSSFDDSIELNYYFDLEFWTNIGILL